MNQPLPPPCSSNPVETLPVAQRRTCGLRPRLALTRYRDRLSLHRPCEFDEGICSSSDHDSAPRRTRSSDISKYRIQSSSFIIGYRCLRPISSFGYRACLIFGDDARACSRQPLPADRALSGFRCFCSSHTPKRARWGHDLLCLSRAVAHGFHRSPDELVFAPRVGADRDVVFVVELPAAI